MAVPVGVIALMTGVVVRTGVTGVATTTITATAATTRTVTVAVIMATATTGTMAAVITVMTMATVVASTATRRAGMIVTAGKIAVTVAVVTMTVMLTRPVTTKDHLFVMHTPVARMNLVTTIDMPGRFLAALLVGRWQMISPASIPCLPPFCSPMPSRDVLFCCNGFNALPLSWD